jgi:hypothetical protein
MINSEETEARITASEATSKPAKKMSVVCDIVS